MKLNQKPDSCYQCGTWIPIDAGTVTVCVDPNCEAHRGQVGHRGYHVLCLDLAGCQERLRASRAKQASRCLLALDPGWTATGWCLWGANGYVVGGVVRCAVPGGHEALCRSLEFWRTQHQLDGRIERVAVEKPDSDGNSLKTSIIGELYGALSMWCAMHSWPIVPVPVKAWRAAYGIDGGRELCKHQALTIVKKELGLTPKHDEAEAVLIARFVQSSEE